MNGHQAGFQGHGKGNLLKTWRDFR